MTQPKLAKQRGRSRLYDWRGVSGWSVTSLIGALNKPALPYWSAKATATCAVDNVAMIAGLVEKGDREGAIDFLKRAPWRDSEKAAELGTSIHAAIEAHTIGKPQPPWAPAIRPKMAAFGEFLADFEPVFLVSEATVFNRSEHYAGTLDAIAKISASGTTLEAAGTERTFLLDFKTGKGVYPESALQLAAYRFAEFICAPDGSEQAIPPIDAGAVLHLTDEAYELIEVVCDEAVFKTFLYVRECFRWQEEQSKTVLLPAMLPLVEVAA